MKKYTTVQGDMWDVIAYKQLGDTRYTDALLAANPQYRNIFIFSAGIELVLPDVEKKRTVADLPPWKRVSG